MTVNDLAARFRALHRDGFFILPNAWDAASAALIVAAAAKAIGTTSSGVSWALGAPNGEGLKRGDAIDMIARIARAVPLPVSADLEEGYGATPAEVGLTIEAAIDAGAVGANLEDRLRTSAGPLRTVEDQCERLAAARSAADRRAPDFVINARTDIYLAGVGDPADRQELTLQRAKRYREAGADCLFVPGVVDLEVIRSLARNAALPLNIMIEPGRSPDLRSLEEAGVRRASVGHFLAAHAYGAARRAANRLLAGEPEALGSDFAHGHLQDLMRRAGRA